MEDYAHAVHTDIIERKETEYDCARDQTDVGTI